MLRTHLALPVLDSLWGLIAGIRFFGISDPNQRIVIFTVGGLGLKSEKNGTRVDND